MQWILIQKFIYIGQSELHFCALKGKSEVYSLVLGQAYSHDFTQLLPGQLSFTAGVECFAPQVF